MPDDFESLAKLSPALEAAFLKKLEAETAALHAEAAVHARDAEVKAAEARKQEAYALAQEVSTRASERSEQLTLAGDYFHRVYHFNDQVDDRSVDHLLSQLWSWHRIDKHCDMTIIMDSPGGSVVDGMHALDDLVALSRRGGGTHHITMKVRGYAASMAGILLQAVDERVMGARSSLLIHQVSGLAAGSYGELKDRMKWLDQLTETVIDIFMDRVDGKISREDFIKGWERTDWWVPADESVRLGFADRLG